MQLVMPHFAITISTNFCICTYTIFFAFVAVDKISLTQFEDNPAFVLWISPLFLKRTFVVVWSLSCVQFFVTPWTIARQASLSFTVSRSLGRHGHWVNDAIQPSHPLSPPFPSAFNPSQHQGLNPTLIITDLSLY